MNEIDEILHTVMVDNTETKKRFKVLLVDDYVSNLLFVSELLEQNNIDVQYTEDGQDAIRIAKEIHPDLILLDIAMPVLDGYAICKLLKADIQTHDIPVIFLTALVESEDIIKGFDAGGVDYITKPFDLLELLSRIRSHLELKNKHDKLQLMNSKLIEIVKKRNTELLEANERLSRLDRAKNEFLLHINHHLRTPLNGIMGYSELLLNSNLNPEQREVVHDINKLVERLVKISERSLLFTELRADVYKLDIRPIDVYDLTERAASKAREKYHEKQLIILNNIPETGFEVLADADLLFKCFSIIIDNATKYSPANELVEINCSSEGNCNIIEICDHGPGISDEDKTRIFEVFSSPINNENENGFGLGLAVVKLIMDIQAAEIEITDNTDRGTTIKLIFYNWSESYK